MTFTHLLIASHNAHKVREIGEMIAPLGISVMPAAAANIEEPEETGATFAENAALKAEHAMTKSGKAALADDSGLVVPAIGGAPGIYSSRWAGPDQNYPQAFQQIQEALADNAPDTRKLDAHFACVLALSVPGRKTELFEGRINGRLTFPPRGNRGFGYDPIFTPNGYDITFGEFDPAEKNRISHRRQAFQKFLKYLEKRA